MRPIFKIAGLGVGIFLLFWALEHFFVPNAVPIADARDEPILPLEAAFLFRSLQYIGLAIAILAALSYLATQARGWLKDR